jgi:hypothetical protein
MQAIAYILLGGILAVLFMKLYSSQTKTNQVEQQTPPVYVINETVEQPLPYWTAYGLPEYWPSYLSPYWYYDVPYNGPITGSGGYYPPRHQWSGGRGAYAPHGWGGHPIGGSSGVAVGGGGGGGHGGR